MPTYHVIPHTHWDREWYLSFEHFRVRLVHMMDDLLDILEQRSDFESFTLDGQTIVVDDYLEVRPEARERISRHVREGRLHVGPWYVLPDEFLVSGEAIVRNLMRGRAAARRMGRSMDVGYIPDSFGHIAQMPQILQGFGMSTAVVWRGFGGEPGQEPSEYRWRAPDGSDVLMEHLSDLGYSGAYFNSTDPDDVRDRFDAFRSRIDDRALTSERLVLSGGDHHWPYEELPEAVRLLNESSDGDVEVRQSSLPRFMDALQEGAGGRELPVVHGEMRFGYRWAFNVTGGVYSSRMYLKQANAAGQRLLERYLEPMNALAVLRGGRSQSALIRLGWTYLLQNHPHDSICGCSIDAVHREMMTRFEKLTELGQGVESFAWESLAGEHREERDELVTRGDDARITIFNPSPFHRSDVVEFDVDFFRRPVVVGLNPDVETAEPLPPVEGFVLEHADGRRIPFEIVGRREEFGLALKRFDYPSQSIVDRFRVRAALHDLPPLGLRTLRVEREDETSQPLGDETSQPLREEALRTRERSIENEHVMVEADDRGRFFVTDKARDQRFGPIGVLEDGGDEGDEYNYSPPTHDRVLRSDGREVSVSASGTALRAELSVSGTWNLPAGLNADRTGRSDETAPASFTTAAVLTPFSRHVTFETVIDNTVRDHRLRVLVGTGCRTNTHHADGQFAVVTRKQCAYDPADFSIEVPAAVAPMQRFVTVDDGRRAAALIAVGLPEYELKHDSGGVLALTLLRCTGELARGALNWRPGGRAGWKNATPDAQCIGRHQFRWAFLPLQAGSDRQIADLNRAAESVHLPVHVHRSGSGGAERIPGAAERVRGDAERDPDGAARRLATDDVSFAAIEPTDLVLSALKEAEDGDGIILRIYNPSDKPIDGEVTFGRPPAAVHRTNLEERNESRIQPHGSRLADSWGPYRIHTYRITFEPDEQHRARSDTRKNRG